MGCHFRVQCGEKALNLGIQDLAFPPTIAIDGSRHHNKASNLKRNLLVLLCLKVVKGHTLLTDHRFFFGRFGRPLTWLRFFGHSRFTRPLAWLGIFGHKLLRTLNVGIFNNRHIVVWEESRLLPMCPMPPPVPILFANNLKDVSLLKRHLVLMLRLERKFGFDTRSHRRWIRNGLVL